MRKLEENFSYLNQKDLGTLSEIIHKAQYSEGKHVIAIEGGEMPISLDSKGEYFFGKIFEGTLVKYKNNVSRYTQESFRQAVELYQLCTELGIRTMLFTSLSDIKGIHNGLKSTLYEQIKKSPENFISDEHIRILFEVLGTSDKVGQLLADININIQSIYGDLLIGNGSILKKLTTKIKRLKTTKGIIDLHKRIYEERGLLLISLNSGGFNNSAISTNQTRLNIIETDNKYINQIKSAGYLAIKNEGETLCGPVVGGLMQHMGEKALEIYKGSTITTISIQDLGDDPGIGYKSTWGAYLMTPYSFGQNNINHIFIASDIDNNNGYLVDTSLLGAPEIILPFEEELDRLINKIKSLNGVRYINLYGIGNPLENQDKQTTKSTGCSSGTCSI